MQTACIGRGSIAAWRQSRPCQFATRRGAGARKLAFARKFRQNDNLPEPSVIVDASDAVASPSCITLDSSASKATHWTAFIYSYAAPLSTAAAICMLSAAPASMASSGVGFLLGSAAAILVFGITPVLDVLLGNDGVNPAKADLPALSAGAPYKHLLRGYVLLQLATLLVACRYVAATWAPAAWPAALGLTLSLSTAGAVGFTVAHDLIHSSNAVDQRLAHVQLSAMCYPHWSLSHLSHHVKVATPEDPASARLNESVWEFIPRSVWGNLADGLRMERVRLREVGLPLWSARNRMWSWVATPLAMMAGLWALWGSAAVAVMLGQAVGAVMLLEAVNYVEHYGLTRKKLPSGRYEKTGARHSWNGDFKATNCVAFKIQRHADHHVNASLPYQALSSVTEQAPQLPVSYPLMVMMATLPPVWFSVMNPILEAEQHRLDDLERHTAAGPQAAATEKQPAAQP